MNKLSFETFRIANSTRSKRFFEPAEVDSWSPADTVVGMIGELGEACNVMKKLKRAQLGMVNKNKEGRQVDALTDEVRCKLMEEFAGAMLYFDQLAEAFGIDWQDAIEHTYNEKSKELGFPERVYGGRFCMAGFNSGVAEEFTVIHPSPAQEIHDSKYGRPNSEQPFNERGIVGQPTMESQTAEFDAVKELAEQYRRITLTAPVDDDYPWVRGHYESAMQKLLVALINNGRMTEQFKIWQSNEEPEPEDFSKLTFSVDVEFSQHLDLNHGDRLKIHIKDGKAVGCEVKERRPAAMIITERDERQVGFAEQTRDDEIAIIYAPKDLGSEIDPPEDYDRLMTITVETNPLISVKKVAKGIRRGLRKKFKDYHFKSEAIG